LHQVVVFLLGVSLLRVVGRSLVVVGRSGDRKREVFPVLNLSVKSVHILKES